MTGESTAQELLEGKVIAVIGGSGLIGRDTVAAVAKHGGRVVAASRSGNIPAAILDTLSPNERERVSGAIVDVTDPASVEKFFKQIVQEQGRCDGLVNLSFPRNKEFGARFEEVKYDSFLENIGMHLGGAFLICQKAAALFSAQGNGVIVNCSSIYGFLSPRFEIYEGTPMTKEVEYVMAKAAIIQLTRYLAKYFKGRGMRINCISPGGVFDNQPQAFIDRYNAQCNLKGMLDGQDVTGTIVFLLSDLSTHLTGQNIIVDDGFSL